MAQNNRIVPMKKAINFNIGLMFFMVILIYIIICVFMFLSSKHVTGYEVKTGSLSINTVYEGIAIRDELIVKADTAGYVNYFAKEGEKVGFGNAVCCIDETGQLKDYLNKDESEGNQLTAKDLDQIKNDVINFSSSFKMTNFSECYDFKYAVESNVVKFANSNLLSSVDELMSVSSLMNMCNAPESGIVQYYLDGFENADCSNVNEEWFKKEDYERTQFLSNTIVANGDPIYKLVDDENWSIVIQVDEEMAKTLEEEGYVQVKFLKNQYMSWAKIDIINGSDDKQYAILTFTNSMVTFSTDRFISVELMLDVEKGLKVPNSAIVEKEFFLIPTDFVVAGKDSETSVLRETYSEDGTMSTQATSVFVYNEEDGFYYVDASVLRMGDRLQKAEGQETYTVSKSATLVGVYNINKGYADFKQIQILNSNDEYSIVRSNTMYGLVAYDYIVLDAESVETDEFVYE